MLKFRNGLMMTTTMSAEGAKGAAGGGGGGAPGANDNFLASLPEPLRTNPAFKDIADVGTLATRFADTQKPFAEMLPEKIRGEAYFKDIKDLGGLADVAYNQAKMIGADKNTLLALPKSADDKDGWSALYTKMGRPESADKYEIPKRGEKQDYTPGEVAFQKSILPALHDAGLTQGQVAKLVPAWNAIVDAQNKAQGDQWEANATKAQESLRAEWGASYDDKLKLAQEAVAHYGSPELMAELQSASRDGKTILGDSPQLARLFAKMGAQLQEDGLLGKGEGTPGALSPAEAQQQISAKQADKDFMARYMDKAHPDHKLAVDEMTRLYRMKAGEK